MTGSCDNAPRSVSGASQHDAAVADRQPGADAAAAACGAGAGLLESPCAEGIDALGAQLAVSVDGCAPVCATVGLQVGERPLRDRHLFNVWCASKPVSAVVLLGLLEGAGLSLDLPLSAAGKQFGGPPTVTFGRLLNHSCGLRHPNMVEANLMKWTEAVSAARALRTEVLFDVFSEFSSAVIVTDLIDALSSTTARSAEQRLLDDNSLADDIVYGVSDEALSEPLEHIGFYLLGLPEQARPLYCDALPSMSRRNRRVLGAFANARGLCGFYRLVGQALRGEPPAGFPSSEYLKDALTIHRRARAFDETLQKDCSFAAGFMVDLSDHGYGTTVGPGAVGHTGLMGSPFGWYDPQRRLAASAILNGMASGVQDSDYWRPLIVDTINRAIDDHTSSSRAIDHSASPHDPAPAQQPQGRTKSRWRRRRHT